MKVIYGANSFIGKAVADEGKSFMRVAVAKADSPDPVDYSYVYFWDLLEDNRLPEISSLLYTTGRGQPPDSSLDENPELFEKNVFEFFRLMELLEKGGRMSKDASIVYMSSGHSVRASDLNPYYASSKAAVNSYITSMSKKFAKLNLKDGGTRRINAIAPEAIESPMINEMLAHGTIPKDVYIATRPNMRLLDIQEVVHPTLFLLSEKSTGINGQIIVLGGVK